MSFQFAVDGKAYAGWTSAKLKRGLSAFAHSLDLRYIDRWAADAEPWPIRAGARWTAAWDGQAYSGGWVDVARMRVDDEAWDLSVQARSYTGRLVKCSSIHKTGHWTNATVLDIAKALCEPYGIAVTCDDPGEPLPRFAIREGESVNDTIVRACQIRGLLPITTASGELQLFTVGSPLDVAADAHVPWLDVPSAVSREYVEDLSSRYTEYLLHSNGVGSAAEAFATHTATDLEMEDFQPLVVVSDAMASTAQIKTRALWEANVRAARSEQLTYVFQSPLDISGKLYRPGKVYRVTDDAFGVDAAMMLHECEDDPAAMRFTCSFVRPEAYARYPVVGKPRKKLVRASRRPKRTRRPDLP